MPRIGLDTEAVVAEAAVLADREGLERLTLAGVADAVGVRAPSLYAHVDGLADLRARLSARGAGELGTRLAAAAGGRTGTEALRATAEAYRAFAVEHPGLYEAALAAPSPDAPVWVAAADAAAEVMVSVLAGYGLEGEAAIHGVRIVRAALHGFASLCAAGGFGFPASLQTTWERLIATLDLGLSQPL